MAQAEAQAPPAVLVTVTVPPNCPPGTLLEVPDGAGGVARVVVPPGAAPGTQLAVAAAPSAAAPGLLDKAWHVGTLPVLGGVPLKVHIYLPAVVAA